MIPLYEVPKSHPIIETESIRVVARDLGEEEVESCCFMCLGFQICKMRFTLRTDGGKVAQQCE